MGLFKLSVTLLVKRKGILMPSPGKDEKKFYIPDYGNPYSDFNIDITSKALGRHEYSSDPIKFSRLYYILCKKKIISKIISNELQATENMIRNFLSNYLAANKLDATSEIDTRLEYVINSSEYFSQALCEDFDLVDDVMLLSDTPEEISRVLALGYKFCIGARKRIQMFRDFVSGVVPVENVSEIKSISKTRREYMYTYERLCTRFSVVTSQCMFNVAGHGWTASNFSDVSYYFFYLKILNAIMLFWCHDSGLVDRRTAGNDFTYLVSVISYLEGQAENSRKVYTEPYIEAMSRLHGRSVVSDKRWDKHKETFYPKIEEALKIARDKWENGCTWKNDKMLKFLLKEPQFKPHEEKIRWKLREELKKVAEDYGMKRSAKKQTTEVS